MLDFLSFGLATGLGMIYTRREADAWRTFQQALLLILFHYRIIYPFAVESTQNAELPFQQCLGPIWVKQSIPQLPVEALQLAVLPWRPGLGIQGPGSDPGRPMPDDPFSELRSVVPYAGIR